MGHSDRGSQYAAGAYVDQLAAMGAVASMSRTACCYDNAPVESFFHTLKVELVQQRRWATHDEARRNLFAYIEGYYNRQRIQSGISPRNRQSGKQAKPVSTQTGEDQTP